MSINHQLYTKKRLHFSASVVLLALSPLLFHCGHGCGSSEHNTDVSKQALSSCQEECLQQAPEPQDEDLCRGSCETLLGLDIDTCHHQCMQEEAFRQRRFMNRCVNQCERDPDGDGVDIDDDRCPETVVTGAPITIYGCEDKDGDGLGDDHDQCPEQGTSLTIEPNGCPFVSPPCPDGTCITSTPPPCAGEECDRNKEIPLAKGLSLETRENIARKVLSAKPILPACPDKLEPLSTPDILSPPESISSQQIGSSYQQSAVLFRLRSGVLEPFEQDANASPLSQEAGPVQTIDLPVKFSSVESSCPPVHYTLVLSYYFCPSLPQSSVSEPGHYHSLGFCEWLPLDTIPGVIPEQEFIYSFEQGALLARLYSPLLQDPDIAATFDLTTPDRVSLRYRTLWLKFQVMAHDGNGRATATGIHTRAAYKVLYSKAKQHELSKIPEGHSH